jgi:glucosamine--fructose-6-phosphate aminotransferase (isomerizing)
MCGIFGYIGHKEASPILLNGLQMLEYRGYDSAGLAILNGTIKLVKTTGNVKSLTNKVAGMQVSGSVGIAHTRWATHGRVSEANAHPHLSFSGRFTLVHNGIIENHNDLRKMLKDNGFSFNGETDSEVLVNYLEFLVLNKKFTVKEALVQSMKDLHGAYAYVLIDEADNNCLYAVRQMSPLVAGFGENEYFLSSDSQALSSYVDKVFFLENQSILIFSKEEEPLLMNKEGEKQEIVLSELKYTNLDSGLNGFDHYMHKEIFEQPAIVSSYLTVEKDVSKAFELIEHQLDQFNRIIILACGTSYHAGLIGRYLIEKYARISVMVEYAAEFRYRCPVIGPDDLVIGISQSGETADTLAAVRMAKEEGAFILSLCNVPESSMARESDAVIYLEAGPEIGVASTKAFTTQVLHLIRLTAFLADRRGFGKNVVDLMGEMKELPARMRALFARETHIKVLAAKYSGFKHFLFLGRGINHPVALEGALKLKEISYIHAEGYPAAEMKHGPIALIDENFPVVAVACDAENRGKMISNIMEVKARNGGGYCHYLAR